MEKLTHHNSENARDNFLEKFNEAVESDRWAAAVWRIVDGKLGLVRLTTFNFPKGDMLFATSQLAEAFGNQSLDAPVPDPLPIAPGFGPVFERAVASAPVENRMVFPELADSNDDQRRDIQ